MNTHPDCYGAMFPDFTRLKRRERLEGRAFTGFGPVEIGQLLNGPNGMSMSVRMGGCIAMKAVSGPHTGKIGTQCLNGTFTFDLSGIDLGNPMASTLNGTGTSNCWMVLQKPMM